MSGLLGALTFIKTYRKPICALGIAALVVCGILSIAQHVTDYNKIKNENAELQVALSDKSKDLEDANKKLESTNKELESTNKKLDTTKEELAKTKEDLEYSEGQVELLQESTNALIQQVSSMKKEISRLEKLLNIKDAKSKITRTELEAQLSTLSELVTAKYFFRNSSRSDDSKTWLWGWTLPFSDTSLLVAYDGTIKAGIDFNDIKIDVNESQRTITVTLPATKVLDNNIPQETINVLEVRNNLFNEVTFADYNQFISTEKKVMEQKAIDQGVLKEASTSAKLLIRTFLSQMPGMDTYKLVVQ